MNVLVVDDEKLAMEGIREAVQRVKPDAHVLGERLPLNAVRLGEQMRIDVAFLDIRMRGMSGIELAKILIGQNPRINIIFTTGYEEYMRDAFLLYASGYALKPVTEEKILEEFEHLRYPVEEESHTQIFVQAFGNFEVFYDGKPVSFSYLKTKEMLAYLVDRRGSLVSNAELLAVLWEEEEGKERHSSYLQNMKVDLRQTFAALGEESLLIRQRGQIGVDVHRLDCDYYRWLDQGGVTYEGEYMSQYSWAEQSRPPIL